jgi:hypothetical protein
MMPSTVTLNAVSTTDAYGRRTFSGTSQSIQCRIQTARRLITTEDGRQIPVEGTVYCYGTSSATVNDKLTLPDGTVVPIVAVETRNDDTAAYVTVISFGRA